MERLQSAKQLHDDLKFVKDYEYTLGEDDLLAFGAEQYVQLSSRAGRTKRSVLSGPPSQAD